MKLELIILITITLLLAAGLSGCEEVDERFIGTWNSEKLFYPSYTFYSNKKYSIPGLNGTWDVKNGVLTLKHDDNIEKYNFVFSGNNTILSLTGIDEGIERVYYKVP